MNSTNGKFPTDGKQVNLEHEYEIHNWCVVLGCTPEELRSAVAKVGKQGEAVRMELDRMAMSTKESS
jgi:hypothetical protein